MMNKWMDKRIMNERRNELWMNEWTNNEWSIGWIMNNEEMNKLHDKREWMDEFTNWLTLNYPRWFKWDIFGMVLKRCNLGCVPNLSGAE